MWLNIGDLEVLLVEPSPVQAKIITQLLAEVGVKHVRVAAGGAAALTEMRRHAPSVVISAMYLPEMTGTELVFAMREDESLEYLPFVLVSSETRPAVLAPIRQSGACGIVPKPFSKDQLQRVLQATVEFLQEDDTLAELGIEVERLRVLLVDDSRSSRSFIRRVLESVGVHNCLEAADGAGALSLLQEEMVDLVIADYHMPGMNGRDLVEHIRHEGWQQGVPILMVTSEADEGRLAAVEQAGVSGIFDKPFDPASVKAMLAQIFSAAR
jgi:two-component system, chemotaxis family, chemotaxis protein CheY